MSDLDRSNDGVCWYVAHTYSGYEKKVKKNLEKIVENRGLQDQICEIIIPSQIIEEADSDEATNSKSSAKKSGDSKKKEPKVKEELLFPSYVLIKMVMTDPNWHIVRNIQGVTGFVGPGSKPEPLSDEEVEKMLAQTGHKLEVSKQNVLRMGDIVSVTREPFRTMGNAKITSISPDGKSVSVRFIDPKYTTPMILPIDEIVKVN